MSESLPMRAIFRKGQAIPVVSVAGPGGVGKSLLAARIAQIIARCFQGPRVLLVDGDPYNKGLTFQVESMTTLNCKHLMDVIVGGHPHVEPLDLQTIEKKPPSWSLRDEEGRLFFLPSAQQGGENPFEVIARIPVAGLQDLLCAALCHAADSSEADCVIIDTASIPEPCGAVFASLSNLVILVGNMQKNEPVIQEYLYRLEKSGAPRRPNTQTILNQMDIQDLEKETKPWPANHHPIPCLNGLRMMEEAATVEAVADSIRFDTRVSDILGKILEVPLPKFVPQWDASLPVEWRTIAGKLRRGLIKSIYRAYALRAAAMFSVLIFGILCCTLGVTWWRQYSEARFLDIAIPSITAALGLASIVIGYSFCNFIREIIWICHSLACKDARPILSSLTLPSHWLQKLKPEVRRRKLEHRAQKLHRLQDEIWRLVES